MKSIDELSRFFGSQSALARACGGRVVQQHVYNWRHGKNRLPAEHVLAVSRASGGHFRPYDLRPDLYPDPHWMPNQTR